MSEKVVKIGVKREPGFLYFLRGTNVYKTPMKRTAGKAEKVISGNFTREEGYLYFLDAHGDIARSVYARSCRNATGPSCKCSCKGEHHGEG